MSPTPAFSITIDEEDITGKIAPRLISLTLTECRSDQADQLDLTLDDSDGLLTMPPRGARITVAIGWAGSGLVDKGSFTVDEVEHSGAPDTVTLRARTADLIDTFRQLQERSFHETTLGAIVEAIAFENELMAAIAAPLRDIAIKHIDQTRESDASFIRRLGKTYDAVATVKNEHLLFTLASESRTASGKDLPVIHIKRALGDSHRYHSAARDTYSGVCAWWHDPKYAKRRPVMAGAGGNLKHLRISYANESDARAAAGAEWQRIRRGGQTFDFALALGNPALMPQSPVSVSGFKPQIDAIDWLAVKVTHSISSGGFTSHIEAETKTEPEGAVRDDDMTDHDAGITGVLAAWKDKTRTKLKSMNGTEFAGTSKTHTKKLPLVYAGKQTANRAAKREWQAILDRRKIIKENTDIVNSETPG